MSHPKNPLQPDGPHLADVTSLTILRAPGGAYVVDAVLLGRIVFGSAADLVNFIRSWAAGVRDEPAR